jgi:hypothetical protein
MTAQGADMIHKITQKLDAAGGAAGGATGAAGGDGRHGGGAAAPSSLPQPPLEREMSVVSARLYETLDNIQRDVMDCHSGYQRIEKQVASLLRAAEAAGRPVALGELKGECIALHVRLDKLQLALDAVLVGDRDHVRSHRRELTNAVDHLTMSVAEIIRQVKQHL